MTSRISADRVHWKEEAKKLQIVLAECFCYVDCCKLEELKLRLAVCFFGPPENIQSDWDSLSFTQYTTSQQKIIEDVSQCILKNQNNVNEYKIYVSFVPVLGRTKSENTNFQEWIFRVPGKSAKEHIFIDKNCRVYTKWTDYLTANTLPKAEICVPVNGEYIESGHNLQVVYIDTPSCNVGRDVLIGFDIATTVTSLIGTGICTAALFVPIIAPLVWTGFGVAAASGLYGAGRNIEHLVDRGTHQQTLSFLNTQARSAWLGATVPFFGIAAGGVSAVAATASFTRMGITITEGAQTAMNVTNGVNCVAHGVCFAHDVYSIVETSISDGKVSTIQIFQCIASALLFANAVISTHQARLLLQSFSTKENTGVLENLYGKLSQSSYVEKNIRIRPTNYITSGRISSIISSAIPWSLSTLLPTSPLFYTCIENIVKCLMKNQKSNFVDVIAELFPHVKQLWQEINQVRQYFCTSSKNKIDFKYFHESTNIEFKNTAMKDGDDGNGITIIDMLSGKEKETFHNIIQEILEKENVSMSDIIQITFFAFQRLKMDVQQRELEFQNALSRTPNMNEETLENIFGIKGNRSQFFANDIMKSYKDMKLIAMKQDFQKMIEKEGMQIPLHSSSPFKIFYFKNTEKQGTKTDKFLKILRKADVEIKLPYTLSTSTLYPSENSCFVEFKNPHSKYVMACAINFAEDDNMMGIIILQYK